MVTKILKSIVINAFLLWRFSEQSEWLEDGDRFSGLDKYRSKINSVSSLRPFFIGLCPALPRNADQLALRFSSFEADGTAADTDEEPVEFKSLEERRLRTLAIKTNRNRVGFLHER